MLLSSLAQPGSAAAAAAAIRGLCDRCSGHMQPCLDQLMQLYAQVRGGTWDWFDSGRVSVQTHTARAATQAGWTRAQQPCRQHNPLPLSRGRQALKSGAAARLAAAGGGTPEDGGARLAEEDVLMIIEGVALCVSR
jgi:hypothetical protein